MKIRAPRPLRRFGRTVARLCRTPARWLAHALLLPVDLLFLAFDLLSVNLRKTRLVKNDCRGKDSYHGGPCPPSRKYTNRFLFRLVCREAARGAHGGFSCRAGERVRISYVRCFAAGVTLALLVAAADVGVIHFWPRATGGPDAAARIARLVAERVGKADAVYAAGRYADALPLYQGAVRLAPDDKALWYKTALCLDADGQADEAAYFLGVSAEGDAPYSPAVNRLALLLYRLGRVSPAAEQARRALTLGCADGSAYAVLADGCLWKGDLDDAAKHLAAARDAGADPQVLLLAQAHELLLQKKPADADKLLARVPAGSPFAPLAALYRLDALWKSGEREQGIEQLQSVADAAGAPAWLALVAVDTRFAAGQRAEALSEADKVVDRFGKVPQVKLQLARVLGSRGEDGRAILLARECAADRDLESPADLLLAAIYLRRGLPELAEDCAGRAIAAAPSSVDAMLLAGRSALVAGHTPAAVAHLEAATRAAPDRAEAWQLLASAQTAGKDLAGAEASLRQACKLSPKAAALHEQLGIALLSAGKKDSATKEFETATSLAPGAYVSWTNLGMLAQEAGDLDRAKECYSHAVQTAPTRAVVASNNLAELLMANQRDVPMALSFAYNAHLRSVGSPLHAHVADTLAEALIKAGYPSTALGLAREAAGVEPKSADRRFRLGVAEAAAGNNQEAITALEEAARLQPDSRPGKMASGLADFLRKQTTAPDAQSPPGGGGG